MRLLRYFLLTVVISLVIMIGILAFLYISVTRGPLPQHDGELTVAGLNESVTVIRDEWGVPHIYANNTYDLIFAQGYTQAQDRWWQMEFFRHIGQGRLMEVTGRNSGLLSTDIYIRTVGWSRSAAADYEALPDEYKDILHAFSDGVNAYLESRPREQLAMEYALLGVAGVDITPEPWEPVDTMSWTKVMANDLSGNADIEETLAALFENLPEEMVNDYVPYFGYDDKPTILTEEDLNLTGADAATRNTPTDGVTIARTGAFDAPMVADGFVFGRGADIGSNNWVVSGDRSETGMPLLANDPHLGIQMPSIWYEIGLHCQPVSDECPFDVVGFTFVANPNVVIGHNGQIAWGVTNVGWDTQDLYQLEINPDDPLQYRWNDEWRDIEVIEEELRAGDTDEVITLQIRQTHLGPIISDNILSEDGLPSGFNNENPVAFKWTATHETGTLFRALVDLNRASNWDEFREALRYWDSPAQNFVFADAEGNIGYQTPGRIPVRAEGHTGLLPVDGTTDEYEWRGYVPFDSLPSVFNPERDYIATANQAVVPLSYYDHLAETLADEFGEDSHYQFGYLWADGYRGQRIHELIEATELHNIESFRQIHGDNKMIVAEEIAPVIAEVDMEDEALNDARDWMLDWDYQMHRDSAQAALFAIFWEELNIRLLDDQLALADDSASGNQHYAVSKLFNDTDNTWWDDASTEDVTETRDEIVRDAFAAAHNRAVERLGEDRAEWAWGTLHTATFSSNPLGSSGISLVEDMVNRGPVPTSGGSNIVNATGWRVGGDFRVRSVPSMRMIIDVSDFDNSRTIHTTGQSGHPMSEQYDQMIESWANIEYKPMLFTQEAVQAAAASTLTLSPAAADE